MEDKTNIIYRAIIFALKKHKGQKYDIDKDFFFAHPWKVFQILKLITDDETILCAGLLHDTLEDTNTTLDELKEEFGNEIANIVYEVTKEDDENGKYFPRLKSEKAIIVKFADRLVNLSNMSCWKEKKQNWYLRTSRFWKSKKE